MSLHKIRILITLMSLAGVLCSLLIHNEIVAVSLAVLCSAASIALLIWKLPELSNVTKQNPKLKTLRLVTVFNIVVCILLLVFAVLVEKDLVQLTERQESLLLPLIFAVLILFWGNTAPKLPFNRYTGLRLPWTVRDEETWLVAHRLLGYLSFPCGILCFTGGDQAQLAVIIPILMLLLWIGIPAVVSCYYFYRKFHG